MSSVMPFAFNAVKLYVLTINENLGHVLGKCIGYLNIAGLPKPLILYGIFVVEKIMLISIN